MSTNCYVEMALMLGTGVGQWLLVIELPAVALGWAIGIVGPLVQDMGGDETGATAC
jgi:hypothetical protein